MAGAPAPPTLEVTDDDAIRVRYTLPKGSTHAVVRLRQVGDASWQVIDASTGKLDEAGTAHTARQECLCEGLDREARYEAIVKAKSKAGWGEWSDRSEPLMIFDFAPPAPGAPKLEAASENSIRVLYAAPPGSSHLSFFIREVSEEAEWQDVSEEEEAYDADEDVVATGLDSSKTYLVKFAARNTAGWGEDSPVSAPLKINDFVPPKPGAPVLEALEEPGSLRVRWAAPPGSDFVTVFLRKNDADEEPVDAASGKLGSGDAHDASDGTCVVTGLDGGASYDAQICASNDFGWGRCSPFSRPLKLKEDSSELEVTGSRTWAERDAELRKRAIDVDQAGPSTETVGIKKESKIARK